MPGTGPIRVGGGAKRRPSTRSSVRHTIGLGLHNADHEPLVHYHTHWSLPFARASLCPFSPTQLARPTAGYPCLLWGNGGECTKTAQAAPLLAAGGNECLWQRARCPLPKIG